MGLHDALIEYIIIVCEFSIVKLCKLESCVLSNDTVCRILKGHLDKKFMFV